MEKVHLALETVGLTAEKTKLEHDCREGASELKSLEVRARTHAHTFTHSYTPFYKHCVVAAKIRASGPEEGAAERTVQNSAAQSQGHLQHDGGPVVA